MRFSRILISEDVPWLGHIEDGTVLFSDASLFAMLEITGVPFETLDTERVFGRKDDLNHSFVQLANNAITLTIWQTRGPAAADVYPDIPTTADFATRLNVAYKAHLLDQSLYENRTFLGIQVRPSTVKRTVTKFLAKRRGAQVEAEADQVDLLNDTLALLQTELRDYRPRRLGVQIRRNTMFSEIAETFVAMQTGVWRPIGLTTGSLGEVMFSENVNFEWDFIKLISPGGIKFAALFGLQFFPASSHPFMLSQMLASSYQSTIQHSFRFISMTQALGIIQRKNYFMGRANDPAKAQRAALPNLASDIADGHIVMGDYAFSAMVFADSELALERVASAAWTDLAESGAKIVRENIGLKPAWLAMIPGNEHMRPRSGYVSSRNMASFAPMLTYSKGVETGHWGGPIALFRSPAGTPVRFHWHQDGVGNTLITGVTGAGKTLLTAFLLTMSAARARIIALDHKRGWNVLFHRMGGSYTVLGTGEPMFNPLKALSAAASDIDHMFELFRGCILSDAFGELSPDMERRLALALRMVMELPPEDRSLSEVRAFLGVDPNGAGARLEKWCWGNELGYVLDAPHDGLSLSDRMNGIDTTNVLSNSRTREPALLHLFYRINRTLDGTPALIPIDEGWTVPFNETFSFLVESQIRTIRSKNGVFVFITQGAKEIRDAGRLANVLVEQSPTQIHLPNPRATAADYVDGLKRTQGEFEALKRLQKGSGFFLVCQGDESTIAQLPLKGLDEFIGVLSAPEAALREFDADVAREAEDAYLVNTHTY